MSMLHSTRTRLFILLMVLGLVASWVIANGSTPNIAQAQDPICVDRPDAQKATPPATVWVEIGWDHLNEWREVLEVTEPFAQEFSLDFYIAGVLIGEMGPNPAAGNVTLPAHDNRWEDVALEAMSVAIRSFTWFRLNYAGQYGDPHEITLETPHQCGFWDLKVESGQQINAQIFRPYSFEVSEEIRAYYHTVVARVADLYLVHQTGTHPIDAEYRSTTGEYSLDVDNRGYLETIYDPVSAIDASGSAPGMGQWGTQRWALGLDQTGDAGVEYPQWEHFQQILFHYYTGVNLREVNNLQADGIQTPTYRWNPLRVDWGGGETTPPTMFPGNSYNVTLLPQNTGAIDWGDEIELVSYWLVNHRVIGTVQTIDVENLVQGDGKLTHQINNWPITVPSALQVGDTATLVFDVRNTNDPGGVYFSNREATAGRRWWPLQYTVCVGGVCNLYMPIVLRNHFVCPEDQELIQNGGFEQGAVLWVEAAPYSLIRDLTPIAPHTGNWAAWMGGYLNANDQLYQDFRVPLGTASLDVSFYVVITTTETTPYDYDNFYAVVEDSQGQQIQRLIHLSNADEILIWHHVAGSIDFSRWAGQLVRLRFIVTGNNQLRTSFVLDDVSLVVQCSPTKALHGITVTAISVAEPVNSPPSKDNP